MKNDNKEKSFRPIVGIDLGTTNSAVAYIKGGQPEILSSRNGERIIPSVVLIDLEDNVVIGRDALDALVAMPNRTIAAIKRKMGSDKRLPIADKDLLPYEVTALILEEEIDWDEVLDLENIEIDEECTWEELQKEAKRQLDNLNNLKGTMVEKQSKKANKLIQSLKTTLEGSDVDKLMSGIEDIVDFIIDFEI